MDTANCIVWDISPIIFNMGPLSARWYGLMFAAGVVLAFFIGKRQFERAGHDENIPIKLICYILIGLVIGAFFGHRIFYEWDSLIDNPIAALSIRGGISGLSSHGANIGIFAAFYCFHLRTGIRFAELVDRSTLSAAVMTSFVRIGNLMNSEIVGRETDVPWAFCFPRHDHGLLIPRHPSQIYEVFIGLVLLGLLLLADKLAKGEKRPLGLMFGLFGIIYYGLRFFVELFKEYQTLPFDSALTMGQILSIPFFLIGIVMTIWSFKTKYPAAIVPGSGKAGKGR